MARPVDAAAFQAGDYAQIIETAPANRADPQYWIVRIDSVSGNVINLDAANTNLAGWNSSKEYTLTFAPYNYINTSTNQVNRGAWMANSDTLAIAGVLKAKRWL